LSIAALAAGDVAAADEANEAAWQHISLELRDVEDTFRLQGPYMPVIVCTSGSP
jgi:hypothetical protein